jgi:hypothetical protein
MQVQINAPNESLPDALVELIENTVREGLAHHADRLTRVEIHLRDLNAQKGGVDKRCLIEARPRGLDPVAADHQSEGIRDALRGALEKLQRVLEHRFGKLSSRGD